MVSKSLSLSGRSRRWMAKICVKARFVLISGLNRAMKKIRSWCILRTVKDLRVFATYKTINGGILSLTGSRSGLAEEETSKNEVELMFED